MKKGPLFETTPQEISPEIRQFCEGVVAGGSPMFVQVKPIAGAEFNRCHVNVADHVRLEGGIPVFGWVIWQSRLMLHAEAHCNWLSPLGELIDITPKADREPQVLFLSDPTMKWEGRMIPSRRVARINLSTVRQLIRVHDEIGGIYAKYRPGKPFQSLDTLRILSLQVEAIRLTRNVERLVGGSSQPCCTPHQRRDKRKADRQAKKRHRRK